MEVDKVRKFVTADLVVFCHLALVDIQKGELVSPTHIPLPAFPGFPHFLEVKRKQLHIALSSQHEKSSRLRLS